MSKDINKEVFTPETKLKLEIFRECFREWFPVFLHNQHISQIFIYDFFAGSGKDIEGTLGSPLILLEEAKGVEKQYCRYLKETDRCLTFAFNEMLEDKRKLLEENVANYFQQCQASCQLGKCVFVDRCYFKSMDFQKLFQNETVVSILANKNYGKFLLLDQYGFKLINENVFHKLVSSPKTDFIFFIASSFIKRFKTQPAVTAYFQKEKISFDETQPKECHKVITNYFRSLVPRNKEYYLHSFTIQKGKNYYGLIFGSNHTLGMEKFLKVCWDKDCLAGESNCNVNNDFEIGTLFHDSTNTNKLQNVRNELRNQILNKVILTNKEGLKFALSLGCKPKLFVEVIDDLLRTKRIEIEGKFTKRATNIHAVEEYKIIVK